MGRSFTYVVIGLAVVVVGIVVALRVVFSRPDAQVTAILADYQDEADRGGLTIEYPLDETLFPPEIVPPTFHWQDADPSSDTWLVTLKFVGEGEGVSFLTHNMQWTPSQAQWETIKTRSLEKQARVSVLGVSGDAPGEILSAANISISTSRDEVGAPVFYREVNLPFVDAVKDPSNIRWRFGAVSSEQQPPIVLEKLPVCGNCHSFSADGQTLGMDVDYANDKGSYAFTAVEEEIILSDSEIITWGDYKKDDGEATFGLLSQVSPDGRYAVSTVKDRSVFVPKPELDFSQLFFPIKGILAVYDMQTDTFQALPGADDPEFVQSNPAWSPDGKYIVFARSKAYQLRTDKGDVLLTREECREFLEEGKTFLFDLYRIPFNDGRGGVAEPLEGASHNGMSNYFAKYSPDGKWIVFCKAKSYMLLQPDSELYIIPAEGGQARRLRCNTGRMNSWHSWSPNGKWLVFSSKLNGAYTQLFLTHIDDQGRSSPAVLLSHFTSPDRAANIPEFVNIEPAALTRIREEFLDDVSYVRSGDAFQRANDTDGAMREYRRALRLNPDNAIAHANLGGLLSLAESLEEARSHLSEALRLDPDNAGAHYNLGMLALRQAGMDEAIRHLSRAVELEPDVGTAQRTLGSLLATKGRFEQSAVHLAEAVRFEPDSAAAHYSLGRVLLQLGRSDEAIRHLTRAVQLEPDHASAHNSLGQALFRQGKAADAVRHLSSAARLQPGNVQILQDLAWMLATATDSKVRDGAKAAELAKRACELTQYGAIEPLDVLGVSLAAAGRFADAIWATEKALDLARAAGKEGFAREIEKRIGLYRQGKPYRP